MNSVHTLTLPLPIHPAIFVVALVVLLIVLWNKLRAFLKASLGVFYYPVMLFVVYPLIGSTVIALALSVWAGIWHI